VLGRQTEECEEEVQEPGLSQTPLTRKGRSYIRTSGVPGYVKRTWVRNDKTNPPQGGPLLREGIASCSRCVVFLAVLALQACAG